MTQPFTAGLGVILAARHLDLTEGPMGLPGHVVDDTDRSALRTVLGYVSQQYNSAAPPLAAPVPSTPAPKNLYEAARRLAACMDGLDKHGYEIDDDNGAPGGLRLYVKGGGSRDWVEVNHPHGYWDVTCSSGPDAEKATSAVTIPRAAFDLLLSVAERARNGGSTTPLSQRAIEALDAAGMLPKASAA